MVPLYLLATAFPHSKLTRALVQSPAVFGGLALLYAALLVQCCLSGGGLPEALRHIADVTLLRLPLAASSIWHSLPNAGLEAVSALFRSPGITALAWVHLLLLDFFLAREVMLDGLRTSVFTAHSVLLCFFVGPLGLLSHLITSTATRAMRPRHA